VSREGSAVIGLQMGTNDVASQSGMNMGKARSIVDWWTTNNNLGFPYCVLENYAKFYAAISAVFQLIVYFRGMERFLIEF